MEMRIWISQHNNELISFFDKAKMKKIEVMEDYIKQMDDFLQKVESTMEGPFLLGNQVSLADILIYPWFERWAIIEHFFNFPLPKKYSKILLWL